MKLFTSLLVTGIAAIIIAGCTFTQPTPVLSTPNANVETTPALDVTPSASPAASDPNNPKFTSTLTLLRSTWTLTPIASPTVKATNNVTLTLTLKPGKDTYNLKEPVTATLQLTNAGNKSVFIHKRMAVSHSFYPPEMRDVVFEIRDPTGKMLFINMYYDLALSDPSDYGTLDPGESIEITLDLRKWYGLARPGAYSLQTIYQNQSDPKTGEVAWKGEIWSNAVIITVKP